MENTNTKSGGKYKFKVRREIQIQGPVQNKNTNSGGKYKFKVRWEIQIQGQMGNTNSKLPRNNHVASYNVTSYLSFMFFLSVVLCDLNWLGARREGVGGWVTKTLSGRATLF